MVGDGKTHYIKRQLSQSTSYCTIAVNEAFTPLGAIKKLRRLPSDQPDCAIFFNFTLLPPGGNSYPLHDNIIEVSQLIFISGCFGMCSIHICYPFGCCLYVWYTSIILIFCSYDLFFSIHIVFRILTMKTNKLLSMPCIVSY